MQLPVILRDGVCTHSSNAAPHPLFRLARFPGGRRNGLHRSGHVAETHSYFGRPLFESGCDGIRASLEAQTLPPQRAFQATFTPLRGCFKSPIFPSRPSTTPYTHLCISYITLCSPLPVQITIFCHDISLRCSRLRSSFYCDTRVPRLRPARLLQPRRRPPFHLPPIVSDAQGQCDWNDVY